MMRHTFRGSSLRSVLGLESERDVFVRYKAIRRAEREYLPEDAITSLPVTDGRVLQDPSGV